MMQSSHDASGPATLRPKKARRLRAVPIRVRVHPVYWILSAVVILCLDFLTGPHIQVAILFVFPVAMATWGSGPLWGSALAIALPLVRLPFFVAVWQVPSSWGLQAADTGVDVLVLLALVWVIDFIARQQREISVLEGMLPICGFCRRIRDESGGWLPLERYVADRSDAMFTHTFCPECGRTHYGDLLE